jgi:hypothetical protein
MMTTRLIFGSDIGNVICAADTDKTRGQSFVEQVRNAAEIPGAFTALDQIRTMVGGHLVLISKCSLPVQQASLEWLANHDFTLHTGIPLESVYFCTRRPEKAELAARLGLSYFIDDRLDVLTAMKSVRYRILF